MKVLQELVASITSPTSIPNDPLLASQPTIIQEVSEINMVSKVTALSWVTKSCLACWVVESGRERITLEWGRGKVNARLSSWVSAGEKTISGNMILWKKMRISKLCS